ncbi:hypothetical protein DAC20_144 [Bacteroides phage DAC20]|nr:hypothetical protein DAC19_145 [Bacteroides phage DAC19]QIG63897.1 hypothetical protein DAC20_144 [Bacteroides phage DAC20]QIG64160.1 hypothetical protein DAC22_146 [Bacteroides phage DAC22]QIG64417.1 hypothetical protein DAC23_139 [Bacteroides phage DAC23]
MIQFILLITIDNKLYSFVKWNTIKNKPILKSYNISNKDTQVKHFKTYNRAEITSRKLTKYFQINNIQIISVNEEK